MVWVRLKMDASLIIEFSRLYNFACIFIHYIEFDVFALLVDRVYQLVRLPIYPVYHYLCFYLLLLLEV